VALDAASNRPDGAGAGLLGLDDPALLATYCTYATILDDEMSLSDRAKADLMGQAKFLRDVYSTSVAASCILRLLYSSIPPSGKSHRR
jgi:hypothetical protein